MTRCWEQTVRAIRQLSNEQLQQHLPWRERWTLRDLMMHVLSFPETGLPQPPTRQYEYGRHASVEYPT